MNENESPSGDEVDPRFADDPLNSKGQPRRQVTHADRELFDRRVEECRMLVRLNMTPGDIKRRLSKAWGVAPRTVERYLKVAAKRNRGILAPDEDQALADSLAFWSLKQQDAEATIQRERAMLNKANDTIHNASEERDEIEVRTSRADREPADNERLQILEMRIGNAVAIREQCRRAIYSANHNSLDVQREIDTLKGNARPRKVAMTDSRGRDIPTKSPEEVAEFTKRIGLLPLAFKMPHFVEINGELRRVSVVDTKTHQYLDDSIVRVVPVESASTVQPRRIESTVLSLPAVGQGRQRVDEPSGNGPAETPRDETRNEAAIDDDLQ